MPRHHRTGGADKNDSPAEPLPKPAWNWLAVAGFVIAVAGYNTLPWISGPIGLALAAIGMKRATDDPVKFNVAPAVIALVITLLVCARGLIALGDRLMQS
jgi:hypothetical protein